MKLYQVFGTLKAVHFKERTILKGDFYLMSNDQKKAFLDLDIEPIAIGKKTKSNHYRVLGGNNHD